jgi:hypothetical protein
MRLFCAMLLVGLLAALGCGGPATGEVTGVVTFEGQPIEHGSIAFFPDNGQAPSTGGVILQGKFSVKKVPVGVMRVRINGAKDIKEQKMTYDTKAPKVLTSDELLPPKYSDDKLTELRYEVQAGPQAKDFVLTK